MLWALLGDLGAVREADRWGVGEVSNQSTGDCPDVTSWSEAARALDDAGLEWPSAARSGWDPVAVAPGIAGIRRPRWRGSSSVEARGKQSSSFRSTTPVGRLISGQWTGSSAPGGCMGSRLLPPSCSGRAANFRHSSRSHLLGCATGWVRPPDSPGAGSRCRPGRAGQQTGCVFHLSAPAPYSNRVA